MSRSNAPRSNVHPGSFSPNAPSRSRRVLQRADSRVLNAPSPASNHSEYSDVTCHSEGSSELLRQTSKLFISIPDPSTAMPPIDYLALMSGVNTLDVGDLESPSVNLDPSMSQAVEMLPPAMRRLIELDRHTYDWFYRHVMAQQAIHLKNQEMKTLNEQLHSDIWKLWNTNAEHAMETQRLNAMLETLKR